MYFDLFENGLYNIKAAKLLGLQTAVYWGELMHILPKVKEKGTYDDKGFFQIDRAYVETRTTLTRAQQLECDEVLANVGILTWEFRKRDLIAVDVNRMISFLTSEDTEVLKTVAVAAAKATKAGKDKDTRLIIINQMKKVCNSLTEDTELQQLLGEWVDSIYAKGTANGFLTKEIIRTFFKTITNYNSDRGIQKILIKTSAINGWKDAVYAINSYSKNPNQYKTTQRSVGQQIATDKSDINETITF